MNEEEVAREQARLLHRAMVRANVRLGDLWMHYFSIGGEAGPLEVDAYLHHAMGLPRLQRDALAHALNELVDGNPAPRAPYASDFAREENNLSSDDLRDDDHTGPS